MEIVSVRSKRDITVKFLDFKGYKTKTTYVNFRRGCIKNPYDKTVYEVGYIGAGNHKTWDKEKHTNTRAYKCWQGLLERCYNEELRYKHPTYKGCTICEEWLDFQNFAEWYDKHFYQTKDGKRMHLDKDILVPGNKIYSQATCIIVPQRINMIFMNKRNKTGLPHGITERKKGYNARYNGKPLGTFKTLEEAQNKYDIERHEAIVKVANEYKDELPKEVYEVLVA